MIRLQGKLPRKLTVACSAGVDSMAVVDFLSNNHDVSLAFVHHGTEEDFDARYFLEEYAHRKNIPLRVFYGAPYVGTGSREEYWRDVRYEFLKSIDEPVVTCHHLDDCVETWVFSSMHGQSKIIPHTRDNVIRPFRLTRKEAFYDWCRRKNVPWLEDKSNLDTSFMRNYIRHEVIQKLLVVNPGLHTMVAKKVEQDKPVW